MAEESAGYSIPFSADLTAFNESMNVEVPAVVKRASEKSVLHVKTEVKEVTKKAVNDALRPAKDQAKADSIKVPVEIVSSTKTSLKTSLSDIQKEINKAGHVTVPLGLKRVANKTDKIGLDAVIKETQVQASNPNRKVLVGLGLKQPLKSDIDAAINKLKSAVEGRTVDIRMRPSVVPGTAPVSASPSNTAGGARMSYSSGQSGLAEIDFEKSQLRSEYTKRIREYNKAETDTAREIARASAIDLRNQMLDLDRDKQSLKRSMRAADGQLERADIRHSYVKNPNAQGYAMAVPAPDVIPDAEMRRMYEMNMARRRREEAMRPDFSLDRLHGEALSINSRLSAGYDKAYRSLEAQRSRETYKNDLARYREEVRAIKPVNFTSVGHQMTRAGHQAMWTTTFPAMLAGGMAVREYRDWDAQMGKIGALTSARATDMGAIRSGILELAGNGNRFDPTELGEGYQQIAHFSTSVADNMKVLAVTAGAASTGLGSIDSVSDVVVSALNAYGGTADDAKKYADIMIKMAQEGKGKIEQFGTSLGRVLPIASSLGISLPEVAANITVGTRIGMTPQESANGLRRIMTAIANPSSQGGEVLKRMNIDPSDLVNIIKEKGFGNLLLEINKKAGGNNQAMGDLFGSIRALTQILAVAGKQADAYKNVINDMNNAQGASTKAQAQAQQTLAYSMDVAVAKIKATSNAIVEDLSPSLSKFISGASEVISSGLTHATTLARLNPTSAGVAGAVGAFAVAAPVGLTVAGSAIQGIAELRNVGVTFKSSLIPAAALAAVALQTFAISTDDSSNKLNQAMQTWIPALLAAPSVYKGFGVAGRALYGSEAIGIEGMEGYVAAKKGIIPALKGLSTKRLRAWGSRVGDAFALGHDLKAGPGLFGKAVGLGAGANAAVTAGTMGISALAPLAIGVAGLGALGYATWAQNKKAEVLGAELEAYNKKILTTGVESSFGRLDVGIGDNLSGAAKASVEARVGAIKEAYNKAISEGDTALLESTSRQIQELMSDIQVRSDVSEDSKTAIRGFLASTFDKMYHLKVSLDPSLQPLKMTQAEENAASSNSVVAGLSEMYSDVTSLFSGGHSEGYIEAKERARKIASDRYKKKPFWLKSPAEEFLGSTPTPADFREAVKQINKERADKLTAANKAERDKLYGAHSSDTYNKILARWNIGDKGVASLGERQLEEMMAYRSKLGAYLKKNNYTLNPRTNELFQQAQARLKMFHDKRKPTDPPLDMGEDEKSATGGFVPQPRLSKIAGDMDALINGILSFGNKTDEAAMRLDLLKSASENLSKEVQDAAIQLAKYSDQQKQLEQRKNLAAGFMDEAFKGYLSRGIIPTANAETKHLEKFIDYKGGNERIQMSALRTNNIAQSGGGLIINETGTGRGAIAASLMGGTGGGVEKFGANLAKEMADSVHKSVGIKQACARFVGNWFDQMGIAVKRTDSAAGLINNAIKAGAKRIPVSQAGAGDLLFMKGYGPSGKHVGIGAGGGMFAAKNKDRFGKIKDYGWTGALDTSELAKGAVLGSSVSTSSSSRSLTARQERAELKGQAIALGQFKKLQSLKAGSFSDSIALFSQTDDWMRKAFGSTADIIKDPEANQSLASALKLIFGSQEAVAVVKSKGREWGTHLIKSIVAAAKSYDMDFLASDLRKKLDDSDKQWRLGRNRSLRTSRGMTNLISGGGVIDDYSVARTQLDGELKSFSVEQREEPSSDYNHIIKVSFDKYFKAMRKMEDAAFLKNKKSMSPAERLRQIQGTRSRAMEKATLDAENWLATQNRRSTFDFDAKQFGFAADKVGSLVSGNQSRKDEIIDMNRAFAMTNSAKSYERELSILKFTREYDDAIKKAGKPTDPEKVAELERLRRGRGEAIASFTHNYDEEKDLDKRFGLRAYEESLVKDSEAMRDIQEASEETTRIIQKNAGTWREAIELAGQSAVDEAVAKNKSVDGAKELTTIQKDSIRQDAEKLALTKQQNDALRAQVQTSRQIALEDSKRANSRAVSRMGLPSGLASAELDRVNAIASLKSESESTFMTPEDYNQRMSSIIRQYNDVKSNYTNDSAQGILNSNIDRHSDLIGQSMVGAGKSDYLSQAKAQIYALENAVDAYGKKIGTAVDPKIKDSILEQANSMQKLQDEIDRGTEKWEAYHSTVDAVNGALVQGMKDWKSGLSQLANFFKEKAFQSIANRVTNKLFGDDKPTDLLSAHKPKENKSNELFGSLLSAGLVFSKGSKGAFGGDGSSVTGMASPMGVWGPTVASQSSATIGAALSFFGGDQAIGGQMGQALNASTVVVNGSVVNVNGGGTGAVTAGSSPMSSNQVLSTVFSMASGIMVK